MWGEESIVRDELDGEKIRNTIVDIAETAITKAMESKANQEKECNDINDFDFDAIQNDLELSSIQADIDLMLIQQELDDLNK